MLCPGICFNVVVIVCLRKVACQLWGCLFNCVACLGSFSARLCVSAGLFSNVVFNRRLSKCCVSFGLCF